MLNVDDPGFPIALLAILAGLRLALYVVERVSIDGDAPGGSLLLSPDASSEEPPATPACEHTEADEPPARSFLHYFRPHSVTLALAADAELPPAQRFQLFNELLDSAIIAVVLVFCLIRPFVLQAFFIPSESMIPTLQKGDKLLATKFTYYFHAPHHGDVVVFHAPKVALEMLGQPYDPKHPTDYVKRVIGLPGDRIRIVDEQGIYVNEMLQHEPSNRAIPNYDFPVNSNGDMTVDPQLRDTLQADIVGEELVVPPGHLFVLGDNRTQSHDSHRWGFVNEKELVGRAFFLFWPLSRMGLIH